MRSVTAKKQHSLRRVANDNTAKKIAAQAEEACHLAGNENGPDLGFFEEKYALSNFA